MSEENFAMYENSSNLANINKNSTVYGKMVTPINTLVNEGKNYENESASNFNLYDFKSELILKRQPIYENIKHKVLSRKKLTLKKLFGKAKNNDIIYENLCRGCGYGIFERKNYLCDFCICMVEGPKNNKCQSLRKRNQIRESTEENMYENICAYCSSLYNTQECEFCLTSEKLIETMNVGKLEVIKKEEKELHIQNLDKPKLFDGILGTLKKSSKTKQIYLNIQECASMKPKPVETVNNVKEHYNISPPNEVFNMQRILDQKKNCYGKIRREQHVYGRLKFSEHFISKIALEVISDHNLSKSRELLKAELDSVYIKNSIDCTLASRKRLSTSKFLKKFPDRPFNIPDCKTPATPLSESVCYWVKSLRQQVHSYHSYGTSFDDGDYALCIPKSVPSRSVLMYTYCDATFSYEKYNFVSPLYLEIGMTNLTTTDKKVEEENATFTNNIRRIHVSEQNENQIEAMVDVFKQNLMAKYMPYKQREYQTSAEHSNYSLNTLSEANYVARSSLHRTKWPSEHSAISVMNYLPLSTVTAEKYLTSSFSTCNVIKSKWDRLGDEGVSIEKTKIKINKKKCERNCMKKWEMINTCNNAHGQYTKQINGYFIDILRNFCNNSHEICEVSRQHQKTDQLNFMRLINNGLIAYTLNTNILHLSSNRLQYFNWFQDWLLYNFNPWCFNVKRVLKVLANYNSIEISFKLWAVLNESVKRHRGLWNYDKQGENIYGEAPIDNTVSEIVTKFIPMAFQSSSLGSDFIFIENESVQLIARQNIGTKNMGTSKCIKTNDEVVLRTKTKETLERNKKAQGKFLDLDENVVKINNYDYDKNAEIDLATEAKISYIPNLSNEKNNSSYTEEEFIIPTEEDIYQPIWKFQTVGEALYDSDPEYYNLSNRTCNSRYLHKRKQQMSIDPSIPYLVISQNAEDHGDWETDDEFMFSKQFDECYRAGDIIPLQKSHTTTSRSDSTITSIGWSADIITASSNSNFQHPLFRTVCIFFSLKEPKIRAIVYDYTYNQSSYYFTKNKNANLHFYNKGNRELKCMKPTFNWSSPLIDHQQNKAFPLPLTNRTPANNEPAIDCSLSPVNEWRLNLLNISNMEDEEDLIVSEKELLRSQAFNENTEYENSLPKVSVPQLIKSVSSGNILDIPNVDDKITITERVRSKFPRNVFKLSVRSPKSKKKQNDVIRSAKTESLYFETDTQPEFPIFGVPLEKLEMSEAVHQNVPRFVVDCVAYIERKNFILQDGLYRASGNKVAIDELKRKLSESYTYDSNLLVADDIHTITSLLKQFFRELSSPLIPQHIYDQLGRNFLETVSVDALKNILEEIPDPNRATLKFLIRHLKNVAAFCKENRMPASNLAIVWGPCIFTSKQILFGDIGRMNTLTKLFIENYDYIFSEHERLVN